MNNVFNIFLKKKKRDLILLSVEKMVTKNFFKAFLRGSRIVTDGCQIHPTRWKVKAFQQGEE